jgi:radical SAM protein with 4Fe4S-binding SPASM domain
MFEYPIRMSWDIGKDRSEYFEAMDSLAQAGVFFLGFSGDTFQWDKFPDLIAYGAEKNIWSMASTRVWDAETVERINNSRVDEIGLLIEAGTPLDELTEIIPTITKPVSVSFVVRDLHINVLDIVGQLMLLPVQRVYVAPYFRYVNPPLSENDKKEYRTLVLKAKELRKKGNLIIQDPVACPLIEEFYAEGHSTMCPAGISTCHLGGDLEVYPCPRWQIPCGNLREQSMKTIWKESEALEKIRNIVLKGVSCPHFLQCLGGCRAIVEAARLPLDECDPDCLIQGVFHE